MQDWLDWLLEVWQAFALLLLVAVGTSDSPGHEIPPPATPTPIAAPIVAPERAWACFYDRDIIPGHDATTTRCGWHGPIVGRPITALTYRVEGGSPAWREALTGVVAEIEALTGLLIVELDAGSPSLTVEFEDAPTVKCGGVNRWGCAWRNRIQLAAGRAVSEGILRHELLHVLGFGHAPDGIMAVPFEGEEFTERDREMLRLYGAIPAYVGSAYIRERACIGTGDDCERMVRDG